MIQIPFVDPGEFDYELLPGRIAQFPLERRDSSKLLISGRDSITEAVFSDLPSLIPPESILVFNDTKVIRARLIFSKPTGATIEIFCLEPTEPDAEIQVAFHQTGHCAWKCLVGNVKRWKGEILQKAFTLNNKTCILTARKKDDLGDGCHLVEFSWDPPGYSFSEVLESSGLVPLPPYITRAPGEPDAAWYQTIFAEFPGSVAAPTAGLHFTETVMAGLKERHCKIEKVTLHVGIGTFRPVSSPDISQHIMHHERISISREFISSLLPFAGKNILGVGTTSVRTLETLYWLGVKILANGPGTIPEVLQWDPYDDRYDAAIGVDDSLAALLDCLDQHGLDQYTGDTGIMILPGYRFRLINAMVTNFHMPKSTLLMLIAAFIGDRWKTAYRYALDHNFRFLSYGDACLLFQQD